MIQTAEQCQECMSFHAMTDLIGICKKNMETCFYTDKCHFLCAKSERKTNNTNTFIKKEG